MSNFVYSTVPGKLAGLLDKIREVGVPEMASQLWLKSVGFGSSNDRSLLPVLKFVGFVDSSGKPTDSWKQYRGGNHRIVLGSALQKGYDSLFKTYPNAPQRPYTDLESFFRTHSTAGAQAVAKGVSTFKALAAKADFTLVDIGEASNIEPELKTESHPAPSKKLPAGVGPQTLSPHIHVDVQVHISPESSPEQIDQIFASMGKHLYGNAN
jgi:hypothetical protein